MSLAMTPSVDSVLLLEEGFSVTSCDASDKMLKQAYKTRWDRRKEDAFDQWGEQNYLSQNASCTRT